MFNPLRQRRQSRFLGRGCIHRKFVTEGPKADEMSSPESFEIPLALVKSIYLDLPNLTTLSLTRTCTPELLNILAPSPPPSPMYLADLFEADVMSKLSPPCPTLKVLEMKHPARMASQHCHEAMALAKAGKPEVVPLEKVFFLPVVPKGMTLLCVCVTPTSEGASG
jgi:hypothetical protein